jgi:DNA-binding transcriptional ArsR family regulator
MTAASVAGLGRLLGDPTRLALLDALLDGRAYTVTELRRRVGVAPSTASEHLARLLDGGLLAMEAQGRHRYYRLCGPDVAAMLESLYGFDAARSVPPRRTRVPADVAFARTCYDHLAGTVAVGLADHLAATGMVVAGDPALTDAGRDVLAGLGVALDRPGLRRCLDWSERRPHLAGPVAARLLDRFVEDRWVVRAGGSRAVRLTAAGRAGLADVFGFVAP